MYTISRLLCQNYMIMKNHYTQTEKTNKTRKNIFI